MELPLKSSATTLFLFQLLVFCSENVYTLVPYTGQVAKYPKVSQFDCGAMTKNTLYALNHVRQCHIAAEKLENSQKKLIFTLKLSEKN